MRLSGRARSHSAELKSGSGWGLCMTVGDRLSMGRLMVLRSGTTMAGLQAEA